uniref:Uncharacterized protein LOC102801771 n=1 Tax=Saccoglossus kowalevskii TaxID=10224 RepID=A0ABM0LZ12_SACKO|nr:PREDICTED: uncharacterized protein LOC102801771 [Saccoglossus kowalevskii]
MSSREFTILYTHQKTKKAKTWHDGILKVILQGNKSVLYDDNKCKLDSLYVKPDQVVIGEQLESERYLILIEEERIESNNYKQDKLSDMIATQNKKNIYPGTTQYLGGGEIRPPHTLHPRLPTKRKRTLMACQEGGIDTYYKDAKWSNESRKEKTGRKPSCIFEDDAIGNSR